jgi:hypothetical protein
MSLFYKTYRSLKDIDQQFLKRVLLFILLFSFLLAGLIYWREISSRDRTNFPAVFLWQAVIWSPWLFYAHLLIRTFKNKPTKNRLRRNLIHSAIFFFIMISHWLWFAGYSSYFSPYLGAPIENYGVFPYFFIFWSLFDLMAIVILAIYFNRSSADQGSAEIALEVKRGKKKVLLRTVDIFWISADGYYLNVHSSSGKFLLRRTLKDISQSLPKTNFIRIHRSALINRDHLLELKQLPNRRLEVRMRNGDTHPVSRKYLKSLKIAIKERSI